MDNCKKFDRQCDFSKECFEPEEKKKPTNADRIRSMSDEELAEFVVRVKLGIEHNSKISVDSFDVKKQLEWIQSEAESEEV